MLTILSINIVFIILLTMFACEGNKVKTENNSLFNLDDKFQEKIKFLANKKIYFGHQSIGTNIIDGIVSLSKVNTDDRLSFNKINQDTNFEKSEFFHSFIGKNETPESKISDFKDNINSRFKGNLDIAFMKFCYIDIDPYTDIEKLFENYQHAMNRLKKQYPNILFFHFTVPLKSLQQGPKAWLKRLLGKPVVGYEDNSNREKYNNMMRKVYSNEGSLFDLAEIESTYPSGERAYSDMEGKHIPHLVSEYTDDGSHLNANGQLVVATRLIEFLFSYEN